ncbi:NAD(P)/FAD-dependent oxidoreductase [Sphaerimonospora mesophila]|uniref:NAD(P)/FAD-dependent oxidoreductase n=1 Tax=Sphaerimonospora mesophila TaxID=37483 RepID=UPI0006E303A2
MSGQTADVVIIGAGVMGNSVALELARAGRRVVVVDRGPGPGHGSTSASSAIVRFNYSTWTGVVTAWESKHAWERWGEHLDGLDDGPLAKYFKTGGLALDSPDQDFTVVRDLFQQAGVTYQVLSPDDIRAKIPGLSPDRHYPPKSLDDKAFWDDPQGELFGLWTPDSGFIDDPALAARNLLNAARRSGVEVAFRTAVVEIRSKGRTIIGVTLADGTRIDAPVVINCAGPHSAAINALVDGVLDDFTVTTRPLRQEVHEVPAPPGYGAPGPIVADLDLGVYFRGTPGGNLLVGGTEPRCDPLHWLDDPDDYHGAPTQAVYEAQTCRAARRLPDLALPHAPRGIVGIYDVSSDWTPIYDRTAVDGYYVAIGTSGNQFKNAPIVGLIMHTLITACENGRDHDTDPVQLRLPYTGHVADLGHYSRRREMNETSGTVMG